MGRYGGDEEARGGKSATDAATWSSTSSKPQKRQKMLYQHGVMKAQIGETHRPTGENKRTIIYVIGWKGL